MDVTEGEIWVNGEYDAAFVGSLDALAAKTSEAWFRSDQLRLIRSTSTTIDGIPARELVLERERDDGKVNYVHVAVGLRAVPRGVGVIYMIGLKARKVDDGSEKAFAAILKSFRVSALPN